MSMNARLKEKRASQSAQRAVNGQGNVVGKYGNASRSFKMSEG
jgi:hypothetical protein